MPPRPSAVATKRDIINDDFQPMTTRVQADCPTPPLLHLRKTPTPKATPPPAPATIAVPRPLPTSRSTGTAVAVAGAAGSSKKAMPAPISVNAFIATIRGGTVPANANRSSEAAAAAAPSSSDSLDSYSTSPLRSLRRTSQMDSRRRRERPPPRPQRQQALMLMPAGNNSSSSTNRDSSSGSTGNRDSRGDAFTALGFSKRDAKDIGIDFSDDDDEDDEEAAAGGGGSHVPTRPRPLHATEVSPHPQRALTQTLSRHGKKNTGTSPGLPPAISSSSVVATRPEPRQSATRGLLFPDNVATNHTTATATYTTSSGSNSTPISDGKTVWPGAHHHQQRPGSESAQQRQGRHGKMANRLGAMSTLESDLLRLRVPYVDTPDESEEAAWLADTLDSMASDDWQQQQQQVSGSARRRGIVVARGSTATELLPRFRVLPSLHDGGTPHADGLDGGRSGEATWDGNGSLSISYPASMDPRAVARRRRRVLEPRNQQQQQRQRDRWNSASSSASRGEVGVGGILIPGRFGRARHNTNAATARTESPSTPPQLSPNGPSPWSEASPPRPHQVQTAVRQQQSPAVSDPIVLPGGFYGVAESPLFRSPITRTPQCSAPLPPPELARIAGVTPTAAGQLYSLQSTRTTQSTTTTTTPASAITGGGGGVGYDNDGDGQFSFRGVLRCGEHSPRLPPPRNNGPVSPLAPIEGFEEVKSRRFPRAAVVAVGTAVAVVLQSLPSSPEISPRAARPVIHSAPRPPLVTVVETKRRSLSHDSNVNTNASTHAISYSNSESPRASVNSISGSAYDAMPVDFAGRSGDAPMASALGAWRRIGSAGGGGGGGGSSLSVLSESINNYGESFSANQWIPARTAAAAAAQDMATVGGIDGNRDNTNTGINDDTDANEFSALIPRGEPSDSFMYASYDGPIWPSQQQQQQHIKQTSSASKPGGGLAVCNATVSSSSIAYDYGFQCTNTVEETVLC